MSDAAGGGAAALPAADQALLAATILLFLALSVVSGRTIWRQYWRPPEWEPPATTRSGLTTTTSSQGSYSSIPGSGPALQTPTEQTQESASAATALLKREAAASASIGAEMRYRLYLLMFVGSALRVGSLVTEVVTLKYIEPLPSSYVVCRLLAAFLWLPSMVFVTMYGLVLLFWAQLCYACWGKAHPWPRRVFFAFNIALYAGFATLIVLTKTSSRLWRACDFTQGALYFGALFAIAYYSIRLIHFFRRQGPNEEVFFDLPTTTGGRASRQKPSPRQVVLRRITAVCVLLCVLFAVKTVYLIGRGTGFMHSSESHYTTPVGVQYIASEFLLHFFTELVPCAMLLYFTKQGKKQLLGSQRAVEMLNAPSFSGGYSINKEKLAALAKPFEATRVVVEK